MSVSVRPEAEGDAASIHRLHAAAFPTDAEARLVALIRAGMDMAEADYLVVLGDPAYYRRFGFRRALDFGLENEYGARDESWCRSCGRAALRACGVW